MKIGEWQEDRRRIWQRKRRNNRGNWEREGLERLSNPIRALMERALMESGVFPVSEEHTGDPVCACVVESLITKPRLPEPHFSLLPSMQSGE